MKYSGTFKVQAKYENKCFASFQDYLDRRATSTLANRAIMLINEATHLDTAYWYCIIFTRYSHFLPIPNFISYPCA